MTLLAAPAPVARILFDESHGEAWTISPERAAQLQPAHPADSSYAGAAAALPGRIAATVELESPHAAAQSAYTGCATSRRVESIG